MQICKLLYFWCYNNNQNSIGVWDMKRIIWRYGFSPPKCNVIAPLFEICNLPFWRILLIKGKTSKSFYRHGRSGQDTRFILQIGLPLSAVFQYWSTKPLILTVCAVLQINLQCSPGELQGLQQWYLFYCVYSWCCQTSLLHCNSVHLD